MGLCCHTQLSPNSFLQLLSASAMKCGLLRVLPNRVGAVTESFQGVTMQPAFSPEVLPWEERACGLSCSALEKASCCSSFGGLKGSVGMGSQVAQRGSFRLDIGKRKFPFSPVEGGCLKSDEKGGRLAAPRHQILGPFTRWGDLVLLNHARTQTYVRNTEWPSFFGWGKGGRRSGCRHLH